MYFYQINITFIYVKALSISVTDNSTQFDYKSLGSITNLNRIG